MEIKIYKQKRRSLMLRPFPNGIEVYIPYQLSEEDKLVQDFIQKGIAKYADKIQIQPEEKTSRAALLAMVSDYATQMQVQPKRVQLRDMRRKWGSCSNRGSVTLNTRLTWLDSPLAEYVVCHEVAHLLELNHSPKFWAIVERYMPDYKKRLKALREVERSLW